MTLAEAIAHEDWAASTAHGELADEHAQMRDWLRELERLRSCNCTDGERTDLAAENAKLRELVADTYQAFQRVIPDGHRLDLEQRMRELGVEVDQDG